MGDVPPDEDPGWPGIGQIVAFLVPGYLQRSMRGGDQLTAVRGAFVYFSVALVAFAIVLQVIGDSGPNHVMPWIALLAVVACTSVIGVQASTKPLDCSSESNLASSYRKRFFATIALSESVALFGFVFAFIGAPTWIYDVGAAFALVRFWTVDPPTPRRIARHQAALEASGCRLSLIGALRRGSAPPPP